MKKLTEFVKIGDIHLMRIKSAIINTQNLFPLNAKSFIELTEDNFVWLDLLINRFEKLHDLIGSKIIDCLLEIEAENINHLTMLDKIHKMEKLEIIKDAELWKQMRAARNHIAHEYPENPALMAKYINQIFMLTPDLLDIFGKIKTLYCD